ncbi:xanthine dehydrogenase family protein subunit M [Stigmatella sp. ncwal1]|uniref:Xanthine dehydrogenase family protein subunit M n=1 Tax=Stigmatella ashevillensis TaxID=2995309 RepID=A0ABT5DJJ9_9BACT|nr:xanthine dehydrogenase family protein subunit M [Stigmatella ashevillena]MDC0713832.1 xanthine dehydrogenase family protein subunit M [Stigmatella ashevillena]
MRPIDYTAAHDVKGALQTLAARPLDSAPIGGGTNLVDLMKIHVQNPALLVDINGLPLAEIQEVEGGLRIGALVRNSDLANHPLVRERYPVLSEALLAGASPQLRNMATVGGNILQRTRCAYFRDISQPCNKREPGSGCGAMEGFNRMHAVLGTSAQCIAANPSDMSVALAALDATVHVSGPQGERTVAFGDFHLLPGSTPERETVLRPGELITHVSLPASRFAARSRYLKVRDRASYAFALASAAVAIELDGKTIKDARVALGGVGTKPWRSAEAEKALIGQPADEVHFKAAAAAALKGAKPRAHNAFKVELARRTLVRVLALAAGLA